MYNVVDGQIRFVGSTEANNDCMKEGNVLLVRNGDVPIKHQYGQIEMSEDVIVVDCTTESDDEYNMKKTKHAMRQVPGYKHFKRVLKKI